MPASVPNIVASASFLSQTVALALTTLYTPPSPGLFRVSSYWQSFGGSGGINPTFGWTDASIGAQTYNDGHAQAGVTFLGDFIIQSQASAITLSATHSGTCSYNIYVVIEQLA